LIQKKGGVSENETPPFLLAITAKKPQSSMMNRDGGFAIT
jgi:hypothetical protein